ncbi:MAG TPA: hypothetical protein VH107_10885 [Lacipirellulaceae bacterium]|nr:hypothetical protein [Lacipirellulaceae bacterium]
MVVFSLIFLFLLGCVLAVIVATGAAVVRGKFALAAVIAGGSIVFAFASVVLLALLFAGFHSPAVVGEPTATTISTGNAQAPQFVFTGVPQRATESAVASSSVWHIRIFPGIIIVVIVGFILARSAKHHFAHAGAAHTRAWPVAIAIAIAAILIYRGFRHEPEIGYPEVSQSTAVEVNARAAAEQATEIAAKYRAQAESLTKQQQELAKRVAALSKRIEQRIDNTDINQLMEEFNAPRIVLDGPFASISSPAALLVAAAPTAIKTFEKSKTSEASSSAAQTIENDHVTSKKKTSNKHNAWASTKKKDAPAALPAAPEPPSAPAPAAAPPFAELSAEAALPAVAEAPIDKPFDPRRRVVFSAIDRFQPPDPAAKKPAWTDNPPKRTGDVRREVIATDEYATSEECYRAADIILMFKAYERLQDLEGNPYPYPSYPDGFPLDINGKTITLGGRTIWNGTNWSEFRLLTLTEMGIDPDFLRREIVAKDPKNNESCEYLETVQRSIGPMKKLYIQIEFTPAVDRMLSQRWDALHRGARFKFVGFGAFTIFGLLSFAWGLLKVDTATKGYYTRWLFVGGPIAIIGMAALSLLVFMKLGLHL